MLQLLDQICSKSLRLSELQFSIAASNFYSFDLTQVSPQGDIHKKITKEQVALKFKFRYIILDSSKCFILVQVSALYL